NHILNDAFVDPHDDANLIKDGLDQNSVAQQSCQRQDFHLNRETCLPCVIVYRLSTSQVRKAESSGKVRSRWQWILEN
nr:hypothetical protein [Tanacetum cinerariifolium]